MNNPINPIIMKSNHGNLDQRHLPFNAKPGPKFRAYMSQQGLWFIALLLLCSIPMQAQDNLLIPDTWPVGTGNTSGYSIYGSSNENERLTGSDPFGNSAVLWVSKPDGSSGPDGGFYSPVVSIDPTKTYRFTVWMKKTGTNSGNSYLGLFTRSSNGTKVTQRLDGTVNTNPYFWFGDLPELNKWYLIVGYLRPNTYTGTSEGRMYDGVTKAEVTGLTFNDYKFGTAAVSMQLRSLLFNDTNSGDFQYYWKPTIYEVNAMMPTVDALLGLGTSGEGLWSLQGNNISYESGTVGIGTTPLTGYTLAVDGNIRAREVKVDNANWPDYVFEDHYQLPTLQEVEQHIKEKGHLINIPSAQRVKAQGLSLGKMNGLLLEKVEELTLYLLDHDDRLSTLESKNN